MTSTPQTADSTVQSETEQPTRDEMAEWLDGAVLSIAYFEEQGASWPINPGDVAMFDALRKMLNLLSTVPEQIAAARAEEREKWDDVRNAGVQLSNIAYNLSHREEGRTLTEHERKVLFASCMNWDAAAIRARGEAK